MTEEGSLFSPAWSNNKKLLQECALNNNFSLTEREGRTGEYWPEVVVVRTSLRSVRTKTTEQVKLVSSLLYGIKLGEQSILI